MSLLSGWISIGYFKVGVGVINGCSWMDGLVGSECCWVDLQWVLGTKSKSNCGLKSLRCKKKI